MATVDIVDVKKVLEVLENEQLIPEYERHEEKIMKVLKEAAQVEATLTTQMVHMIDNDNMREVEQAISAIIGHECVHLIKISFAIETYRMKVVKKSDGQLVARAYRKGVEFQPEIMLMTTSEIEIAIGLQSASLVIELLLFLLSCVGIGVDLSEAEMRTLVQEVECLVRESAFQRVLNKFVDAWNEAGDSAWRKAKALIGCLKDRYWLEMIWKYIRLMLNWLFRNMSAWFARSAIIRLVVIIVVVCTTEGVALIARFALAFHNDVYLAKKIANLVTFFDMKKGIAADIEELLIKALRELEKHQSIPEMHKKEVMEVLKEAAEKEETLKAKISHMTDKTSMQEMSTIIGQEHVDLMKKPFAIETYRMKVVKKHDDQSAVQVHRKGIEFQSERKLGSIEDIDTATVLQWTSLVLELFIFVLRCIGIRVHLSEAEMRKLLQEIEGLVQKLEFQRALNKFVDDWNEAGDSAWGKAKAIFNFLEESYSLGLFWKIINLIIQNMSTWEMTKAIAEVAVMIVAAFATDGLALIARVAMTVNDAVYLGEKIANLGTFSDMKKTMK